MSNSFVNLLKRAVESHSDREAIVYKDRRLTYSELWRHICAVSSFLQDHELKREQRVGILVENSPEYIATYYGILAAGGTVVGLNAAAKARDLINWLQHSEAIWLFTHGAHPELTEILDTLEDKIKVVSFGNIGESNSKRHYITAWSSVLNQQSSQIPVLEINDPNQMASIIYTSGTTGRPKGVTLSHNNLTANVKSIISYLELDCSDKIVNVLPFHYSYGNSVMHTHLVSGACLVLENSMMYPNKILEKIQDEKATGFSGVPSTFALLLNRASIGEYDLSSVRYMTQAGGPMAPASIDRFTHLLPHISFIIMYGQTEATARISYLPPKDLLRKLGSVGIPIPDVRVRICDDADIPVAPGVTGQIQVTGDNLMLGYWKDPDATANVIIDGWLHTGDLGHWDEEGYFYIDGRSSDMIKTGANRVSPKEIEEVILELENVVEVAVVGMPDDILGEAIKAVVVQKDSNQLDKRDILAHCKKNLAVYKIPKTITFTDVLPKTSSGKVRRFMLKD